MRAVLATFDEKRLAKTGLRYTDWLESSASSEKLDILGCPASGPTLDDCSCIETFQITTALKYSCKPQDVPQTDQCCNEFMKPSRSISARPSSSPPNPTSTPSARVPPVQPARG